MPRWTVPYACLAVLATLGPPGDARAQSSPSPGGAPSLEQQFQTERDRIEREMVAPCMATANANATHVGGEIDACGCGAAKKEDMRRELSAALQHEFRQCREAGAWSLERYERSACTAVHAKADALRGAIERQRRTLRMNEKELSEWMALNEAVQKAALLDAGKYLLARFAADSDRLDRSLTSLRARASVVAEHAADAQTRAGRLKWLGRLTALQDQVGSAERGRRWSVAAKTALEGPQAWELARNTWHQEFRVAAKRNAEIREMLQDPGFRNAFAGDADESPGIAVVTELANTAFEDATRFAVGVDAFEKTLGPEISAAHFVVDEAYDALASLLSTERALEAGDVAGDLAKAAGVMQGVYRDTIERLRACRSAGL